MQLGTPGSGTPRSGPTSAGGWLHFEHIPGAENPVDILTKPLAWFKMKVFVEPLLLWKGDTVDCGTGSSGPPNPEGSDAGPDRGVPEPGVPSRIHDGNGPMGSTRAAPLG